MWSTIRRLNIWSVSRWRGNWPLLLVGCFLVWMTILGTGYRRWIWNAAEPVRMVFDIQRNQRFGAEALQAGWLNVYEDELARNPPEDDRLDYPPLRLLTYEAWMAWERAADRTPRHWVADIRYNAFLMGFSTTFEWFGAAAAFLIVYWWTRYRPGTALASGQGGPDPWLGLLPATAAFLCAWFDPGVAIVGHGWPSANVWAPPVYLWAALLCLWDRWFIAGLLLGIGVHLQGQLSFSAAVFIVWPLAAGRPGCALRWICGFALAFALVVSGWMLTVRPDLHEHVRLVNRPALAWVAGSLGLLMATGLRGPLHRRLAKSWFLIPAIAAIAVISLPAMLGGGVRMCAITFVAAIGLACLFWFLRWSSLRYLLALATAACLLGCMPFFGASTVWWDTGFRYGTERFPEMTVGSVSNLPAVLQYSYGWENLHAVVFTIPPAMMHGLPTEPIPVDMRQLLMGSFFVLLLVAGAAIGRQWRQGNFNFLVALVLPWVLFYTICPQMGPRYPVFIAGVGAICVGQSVGMLLVSLFFSALTLQQILAYRLDASASPTLVHILTPLSPGLSWAVIACACVFLWVSCGDLWRRARSNAGLK